MRDPSWERQGDRTTRSRRRGSGSAESNWSRLAAGPPVECAPSRRARERTPSCRSRRRHAERSHAARDPFGRNAGPPAGWPACGAGRHGQHKHEHIFMFIQCQHRTNRPIDEMKREPGRVAGQIAQAAHGEELRGPPAATRSSTLSRSRAPPRARRWPRPGRQRLQAQRRRALRLVGRPARDGRPRDGPEEERRAHPGDDRDELRGVAPNHVRPLVAFDADAVAEAVGEGTCKRGPKPPSSITRQAAAAIRWRDLPWPVPVSDFLRSSGGLSVWTALPCRRRLSPRLRAGRGESVAGSTSSSARGRPPLGGEPDARSH